MIVLGQQRMDEKSNEITAVPEFLDLIDVENYIITSDAMSCQKSTVKKICEKNCDYVICLKVNQETLHDDVQLYFETALANSQVYSLLKRSRKQKKRMEELKQGSIFYPMKFTILLILMNGNEWLQLEW